MVSGRVLAAGGSDLLHLAKATYYVADDVTSRKLNEVRPEYYDPKHPPAASKAGVRGTGKQNRTVTLDMIAVPLR
jgi:enamine deaminase RidA (YjgF/YER057c/UK114 family)